MRVQGVEISFSSEVEYLKAERTLAGMSSRTWPELDVARFLEGRRPRRKVWPELSSLDAIKRRLWGLEARRDRVQEAAWTWSRRADTARKPRVREAARNALAKASQILAGLTAEIADLEKRRAALWLWEE